MVMEYAFFDSIVSLSHNSLDSFEGSPKMLLNSSLGWLDLRSNAFRGPLPIISPRLWLMIASKNSFTGDIPLLLCNQSETYVCLIYRTTTSVVQFPHV